MKAFSELTSASQVNNADLLAISQTSGSGYASKKTTVKEIANKSNLNLAEEYDSTSTYAVDDYVIYESVLYKCIASTTGTFDSTKWTSVVVTDEMGSGGGSGTGGHTIIDENGNSMTARTGLQFVGGANVSDDATNNKTIVDLASAGGIDGVFIDTGNVIKNDFTFDDTGHTWTATEDCIIAGNLVAIDNYTGAYVWVDNITCFNCYEATSGNGFNIPVKKGQVITYRAKTNATINKMTAYGIQTGTSHSKFQPVIYSLEEREIGVWTDGKPLYQKTFVFTPTEANTNIDISSLHIDELVWRNATCRRDSGAIQEKDVQYRTESSGSNNYGIICEIRGTNLYTSIEGYPYSQIVKVRITLQYTKTTDIAGSGSWTPQGVPAVHYSTDEHIIGTWNDKTLYEKTVYNTSSLNYGQINNISTGILDADEILLMTGSVSYGSNNSYLPLPYGEASTNEVIKVGEFNTTNGNVQIFVGNAYQSPYLINKVILTIRYTKSS